MGDVIGVIVPIGIGGIVFFGLWFWAILDCIATDSVLVRNLPKQTWIFIVIFVPTAGALAWLLLGRPEGAGLSVGGKYRPPDYTKGNRTTALEDSPDWQTRRKAIKPPPSSRKPASERSSSDVPIEESNAVKERRLLEWEAELNKREAALGDDASDGGDQQPGD